MDAPGAVLTGEDEAAVPMIQRDVDDRWGVAFDLRSVGVNAFSRFVWITVRLSSQGSQANPVKVKGFIKTRFFSVESVSS